MDTDLKTSILINQQLPQFIREEYPLFQSFLEAYYEFLEKKDGDKKNDLISKSKSIRDLPDVDISIDEFEDEFFNTYANLFPKDVSVDKEFLIKHVLPFYLSKGSEKSFKFLFRLLFNQELSIKYPKNEILRASDGKWTKDTFIRIDGDETYSIYTGDGTTKTFNLVMEVGDLTDSDENGILDNKIENDIIVKIDNIVISTGFFVRRESRKIVFDQAPTANSEIQIYYKNFDFNILKQRKITGVDSGASVIIDDISKVYENRKVVYKLGVDEKTIIGNFISGERLSTDVLDINGNLIYMSLLTTSSLKRIIITNGGSNYNVGDPVHIIISSDLYTTLPYCVVSEIYDSTIDSFDVVDGGAGFELNGKIYALGIPETDFSAHTIYLDKSGKETPNTFPIFTNVISDVDPANTILSSSNWNFPNVANSNLSNTFVSISSPGYYINIGAIGYIEVDISKITSTDSIFNATPAKINIAPQTANTTTNTTVYIDTYGSLGKFKIINGGTNYSVGDKIIFINKPMCLGIGANAYVSKVNTASSNSITEIQFGIEPGHMKGGENYRQDILPSVTIQSANGSNANVIVTTIMGDGENLTANYNGNSYGQIKKILIIDPGSGLKTLPIIDLSLKGDGKATAIPELYKTIEVSPGYWASSDGIISSADKKLQGKNYYVNYSYVTSSLQDFQKYKSIFKKLIHPTGFKHYGEVIKPTTVINDTNSTFSKVSSILCYASTANNGIELFKWINQTSGEMKLTFNTALNGNAQIYIPLGTSWTSAPPPNVTVDWGDGNISTYNTKGVKTHQYASAGTYQVTITGFMPEFGDQDYNNEMISLVSVDSWDDGLGLIDLEPAFYGALHLTNVPTNLPSTVTSLSWAFIDCTSFNSANICSWNTENVTKMNGVFFNCTSFNQSLNSWNVGSVTEMSNMFYGASAFNQPLNNWNVSNVTLINNLFYECSSFNQPLNNWNVSNVTTMGGMFFGATAFNQPLNNWDTSNVTNMQSMFYSVSAFNQPLNSWNTANVIYMAFMFENATAFNQNINSWNVGNVQYMSGVFHNATAFNQPLNSWDVSNVTDMDIMFQDASAFNQNISNWCVTLIPTEPQDFSLNSALSINNKPVWGTCPP